MTLQHTIVRDPATLRLDSRNPLGQSDPVPTQVQNVQQTGATSSSVTLSWDAATDAETYNVYVDSITTPTLTDVLNLNATVSGLTAETGYTVRVSATNSIGEGDLSDPVTMTTSAASAGTRDRRLQPFPSDDPFNMPLGVNAYYAPPGDPVTDNVRLYGANVSSFAWAVPVYFPTESDPVVEFFDRRDPPRMQSYRADEDFNDTSANSMLEHLMLDATPSEGSGWPDVWGDWHLHIINGNELVEVFKFRWESNDPNTERVRSTRIVRNRLDHYSFTTHPNRLPDPGQNALANRSGTRVTACPAIAGLIRKHEVDPDDPNFTGSIHIPHALGVAMQRSTQMGRPNNEALGGDPSSPLYSESVMFPARFGFYQPDDREGGAGGNCKVGMKFAMDPSIVTDSYLASISDPHVRAVVRALRDYGMYVNDSASSENVLYAEIGVPSGIIQAMRGWGGTGPDGVPMTRHLRRVAATDGGSVIHRPVESDWQAWANAGEGWGGGAPRVPYSDSLADL